MKLDDHLSGNVFIREGVTGGKPGGQSGREQEALIHLSPPLKSAMGESILFDAPERLADASVGDDEPPNLNPSVMRCLSLRS